MYQSWVKRLESASDTKKLVSFEVIFLLSRLAVAAIVVPLQSPLARVVALPEPSPYPVNLLGVLVIGVAVAIDIWSIKTFLSTGAGTPAPMKPPVRMVAVGPYRYVRNPMYVDIFLTILGLAVLFDAVVLVAADIAVLLIIHFVVVLPEEQRL